MGVGEPWAGHLSLTDLLTPMVSSDNSLSWGNLGAEPLIGSNQYSR